MVCFGVLPCPALIAPTVRLRTGIREGKNTGLAVGGGSADPDCAPHRILAVAESGEGEEADLFPAVPADPKPRLPGVN
jgi:hypothetical protein